MVAVPGSRFPKAQSWLRGVGHFDECGAVGPQLSTGREPGMCQGCAGPWDRDLALLADALKPSCPICREVSGPELGQEGGLRIRRKERGLCPGRGPQAVWKPVARLCRGEGGTVPGLGHVLSEAWGAHSLMLWAWDSLDWGLAL